MTAPDTHIPLPDGARFVLSRLEEEGFESWVVGGFVRDALRGAPSADTDIATAAPWREVARIFSASPHAHVVETGTAHGTVTVVVDRTPFEVTTFRLDGPYADGRHPAYVAQASSIEEDLARRDFTVNAIAYHPERGLLDPYRGAEDLSRGIIRTVGDPDARLAEDALRILRACRFSSQLGFSIDPGTMRAMRRAKHLLARVSAERVAHELGRLLVGPNACGALLETSEVIAVVVPEIVACVGFDQKSPYHCYDVYEHIARTVEAAAPDQLVRWAAFCHDLGKPAVFFTDERGSGHFYGHARVSAGIATGIMRRLKMPTALSDKVVALVLHHDDEIPATRKGVARALERLGGKPETLRALCELKRADSLAHAPEHRDGVRLADALERALDDAMAAREPFAVKDLAINGCDVIAHGVRPGPSVGRALRAALAAVIDGETPNERGALNEFIDRWKKDEIRG